jgi:hypothetical protein
MVTVGCASNNSLPEWSKSYDKSNHLTISLSFFKFHSNLDNNGERVNIAQRLTDGKVLGDLTGDVVGQTELGRAVVGGNHLHNSLHKNKKAQVNWQKASFGSE